MHRSRDRRVKKTGGGVAVAFNPSLCYLKQHNLKNTLKDQEIMCAVGRIAGIQRVVAVFVLYLPPRMRAADFTVLCDTLSTEVAAVKASHPGVAIFVGGDLNHQNIECGRP